ncbi:hypothetical protein BDV96DRAFT_101585 [Lophiotrema nucula]|uniref:Uncharacterized protein n=1 Tax=Lophiotrema nucula TaxID=690887 RepID=A0A6A5Z6F5_9PLEO|nr:hypothetical protein BDV96DRAFT_101585 [Lophiotrema nucula]
MMFSVSRVFLLKCLAVLAFDDTFWIHAPTQISTGTPTNATLDVDVHNGDTGYASVFRVYLGASVEDQSAVFYSRDCYLVHEQTLCDSTIGIASDYIHFKNTTFTVNIPASVGPSGAHYVLLAQILQTDGSYYGATLYSDVFTLTNATGQWGTTQEQGYTLWGADGIACSGFDCVKNCSNVANQNYKNGDNSTLYNSCANSCPNVFIDPTSMYGGQPTASLTKPTACSVDQSAALATTTSARKTATRSSSLPSATTTIGMNAASSLQQAEIPLCAAVAAVAASVALLR